MSSFRRSLSASVAVLAMLAATFATPALAAEPAAPQSSTRIIFGIKVESTGGCLLGIKSGNDCIIIVK